MNDMGGIVSFELKGGRKIDKQFIDNLHLALISLSLGESETLVQYPDCRQQTKRFLTRFTAPGRRKR
ncbi:PLP-dependent transferase [Sporosarcina cascadiensis]|uniref:PLP-dependent transferase n=1 Tax=Sporosarcina cascadiensis TaxID=2660747 RepID=UPI00129B57BD